MKGRKLLAVGKETPEEVKGERQRTSVSIVMKMYENFILKPITIYTYKIINYSRPVTKPQAYLHINPSQLLILSNF